MDPHSEIEVKYLADSCPPDSEEREDLKALLWEHGDGPNRFKFVEGTDYYYRQGPNVIRLRVDTDSFELTVKQRKSTTSTTDRVEIDLPLAKDAKLESVQEFLRVTGWELELTLCKKSWIWQYEYAGFSLTVALYDVEEFNHELGEFSGEVATFFEVEVDKVSKVSAEKAAQILTDWCETFKGTADLEGPVNQSLYELYSGNQYTINEESK